MRGDSMRFLLKAGDAVLVERARLEDLRPGDLAVVLEWSGREPAYVVHRLVSALRWRGERYALTKGDANLWLDAPVAGSALVGRVAAAEIAGRWRAAKRLGFWRAALLSVAAAPLYRLFAAADRLSRRALTSLWSGVLSPLRARRAQRLLLSAMARRDRLITAGHGRLQRRAAAFAWGAAVPAPEEADAARPAIGYLDGERAWSGRVNVEGDVFVPPGAILRVAAGTDVRLAESSRWDCTAEQRGWRLHDGAQAGGLCRIVVAGQLLVEGSDAAPARFGGAPWSGIHFVSASIGSRLEHAELDGCEHAAVSVCDTAQVALSRALLSNCGQGIAVHGGGAQAALADCRLSGCRHRGLSASEGRLTAVGSRVEGSETGVFLERGELLLERCEIAEGRLGVGVDGGEADLREVRVRDMRDAGLELDGRRQRVERTLVERCPVGVRFAGDRLQAVDLRLSDCGTALAQRRGEVSWRGGGAEGGHLALEVSGGSADVAGAVFASQTGASARVTALLKLADARIERCAGAFDVIGGALEARRLDVKDCPDGISVRRGSLTWTGGSLRGGGGLRIADGSRAVLREVSLEDGAGHAVELGSSSLDAAALSVARWSSTGIFAGEGSALSLRRGRVQACRFGVGARSSAVRLYDVGVEGCAETAVDGQDLSLEVSGLTMAGCGGGLTIAGGRATLDGLAASDCRAAAVECRGAEVALDRLSIQRCGRGVAVSEGRARLRDVSVSDCSGCAVQAEKARLELAGLSVSGCEAGVALKGGSALLSRVRARGCRQAALAGEDLSIDLRGLDAEDCGQGLSLDRARATVLDASLAAIAGCALRCEAGALDARSLRVRGARSAARLSGKARLERAEFDGCGSGIELDGGSLEAQACRWSEIQAAAVRLTGRAEARLALCRFDRCAIALGAASGRSLLRQAVVSRASQVGLSYESGGHEYEAVSFHGCLDRVFLGAEADVREILPPRRAAAFAALLRRSALAAVLRTRRWPGLAALYRGVYALPVRALQAAARADRRVVWLAAHRSWAAGAWEPGTSDVDLAVCVDGLDDDGQTWLAAHWRRWRALKRLFPFLGECLAAEPAEWRDYARWGGFRARGFARQLAPLAGRLPEDLPRAPSPKRSLEPLGEATHAYTRLMAWALWRSSSPALAASHAEKAARDLLRLRAAAAQDDPSSLPPRENALELAGEEGQDCRSAVLALREAAGRGADDAAARAALCAAGLRALRALAASVEERWSERTAEAANAHRPQAAAGAAAELELTRRRAWRRRLEELAGPALIAGCCDDVYRSWLVLEDEAPAGGWEGLFARLDALPARDRPGTLPLVVTRGVWRAWSRLPYLESPLRFLEAAGAGREALYEAGEALPGTWQYAWNPAALEIAAPAPALSRDLAREALATLRCTWRFHASPTSGLSTGYAAHYLLSRTMALRLVLERGVWAPTFGLEPLRRVYAREFPEDAAGLEAMWRRQIGGGPDLPAAREWTARTLRTLPLG